MSNYYQVRQKEVSSLEDIQKIFDIAEKYSDVYKVNELPKNTKSSTWIVDTNRYYKVHTRVVEEVNGEYIKAKDYPCTWVFDKTGITTYHINPNIVARMYQKVYKPYNIIREQPNLFYWLSKDKIAESAKPIVGFNPKWDKQEHNVVCYDLNSAYAAVLSNKIPDTYKMDYARIVKKGEIGFIFNIDLMLVQEGGYADIIMPLIDSPYKDFVNHWYNVKKTATKGSKEKSIAKEILVITVGLWQKVNPFLRAYVVNSCNEFIESLMEGNEDDICIWNTDAIYAIKHIPEIDALVGDGIGKFKIEYEGLFRQKGTVYQKVDLKETAYRGVINMSFTDNYNLLTDELPKLNLPYKIGSNYRIELNEEFDNE